jgi:hypothetical protein
MPGPAVKAPADGGRSAYLWTVLRDLWPQPAHITRYRYGARGNAPGATEFLVLPSEGRATLLIPAHPRRAAAGALRNYKASGGTRDRLQFRALALAARTGLTEVLPHRIRIEPGLATGTADITGYLRAALRPDVLVSLHIGPPRANRKPVLQALTPDGEIVGFVKVGVDVLTRELVRAEASALAFLADARLTRLQAPLLLHHGQWGDHEILVQQPFSASRPARNGAELSAAMSELAGIRGIRSLPAAQSPYWQRLRSRLQALARRDLTGPLLAALDGLEPMAAATSLAFGSWHGDWTPWNMTMSQHGRALVWDWERFETGVPVGYDAVHYHLNGAMVRAGIPAETAAQAVLTESPGILAPFGVAAGPAGLVATLYLVEIATRYLHDGQAEAGARLGRIDTWLLPAVVRHARQLSEFSP